MAEKETGTGRWRFRLAAEFGHRNITSEVNRLVKDSGVKDGIAVIAVVGSTAAITTIEYEEGALRDLKRALDHIAPKEAHYDHNARWHDGNGFSHVRSALLKTSISVPVIAGDLALGTWQQIVLLNLDNTARDREVVATIVG